MHWRSARGDGVVDVARATGGTVTPELGYAATGPAQGADKAVTEIAVA